MTSTNMFNPMKKRGQIDPISLTIGAIILGGVLILGYIGAHGAIEDTRYVFDSETNTTYDILKCESHQLPDTAIALRGGLDELKEIDYQIAIC